MIKKLLSVVVGLLMVFSLAACGSSGGSTGGANDGPIEIRIATAMDYNHPQMSGYPHFEKLIQEKLGDRVKITYVGGPEAIPAFNQGEAIQNGSIDMSWVASSYYAELVPEALITNFTGYTYEEELEMGSIEFLSSIHEKKMNAKLVGRSGNAHGNNYTIYLNGEREVKSMEDFKGLKIRGTATYAPLLEELGADVISMPGEEIYSALEKGIIDGFAWASYSVLDLGVEDLIAYQVLPKFNMADQLILANLDFWNGLPEEVQKAITEATIESYHLMREDIKDLEEHEQSVLKEHGVELVELTDGEEYKQLALDKSWEWMAERVDNIEELEKYFKK
ncbi:TRAP-type C4-dicarboxylate transport system substrate-binding protein OS=Ureibacillus acetophenoni OX=614649 GN=SAMN05877842_107140 PE=4 SV=1 [Ureibacillus acetophenoni]